MSGGGMPTVLVTGSSGLIGSATVRRLARAGYPVLRGRRGSDDEPAIGDVRDPSYWRRALVGVDVVVHLAAQTSVRLAERDPALDHAVNVTAVRRLLAAATATRRRPSVFLAGTETQAGVPAALPLDERAPDRPVTVYDKHKLAAERLLESAVRRGDVRGACLRLPTVYGPGSRDQPAGWGVVTTVTRQALAGTALSVFGTGAWRREFLHVDDVADAFVATIEHAAKVSGQHFLLGTGTGVTVADLMRTVAAEVAAFTGREPVPVRHVPVPPGWSPIDERDVVIDSGSFRSATRWAPRYTLATGLLSLMSALSK